jgi:hypothetical protein
MLQSEKTWSKGVFDTHNFGKKVWDKLTSRGPVEDRIGSEMGNQFVQNPYIPYYWGW